jgi:hypothetical protein
MRKAVHGLWVDQKSISKVKNLLDQGNHVVLMPLYKSFADSFV